MTLRIGFAKGRGAADAMDLLKPGGVHVPEAFRTCRVTIHRAPEFDLDCFILRGDDLPALLASGHVDVAVGSSIVFDEHDIDDASMVAADLDIGRCRLSLISSRDAPDLIDTCSGVRRLCTRYPCTTARLVAACGDGEWSIRPLHGCVEAALFLGLCDAIVDIIETGWTMRALALQERRVLCTVQHQVRTRADSSDLLTRLNFLMPGVVWSADATREWPASTA